MNARILLHKVCLGTLTWWNVCEKYFEYHTKTDFKYITFEKGLPIIMLDHWGKSYHQMFFTCIILLNEKKKKNVDSTCDIFLLNP